MCPFLLFDHVHQEVQIERHNIHSQPPSLEPVRLHGQGEFNLDALKELKVTDSFLGMDENVRKCQYLEPLNNCTTRELIGKMIKECDCLPFNINKGQVKFQHLFVSKVIDEHFQEPLCSIKHNDCVKNVKVSKHNCLEPCSGMIIRSFSKAKGHKVFENKICSCYRKYTKWHPFPPELKGRHV